MPPPVLFADLANDAVEIGAHSTLIGAALHVTGDSERADEYLRRAREQFEVGGASAVSVRMAPLLAYCLIRDGRWDEARQDLDAAVRAARSMLALHPERTALALLANLDLLEGRPHSASTLLDPVVSEERGWAHTVSLLSTLAEAYMGIGDSA